MPEAKKLEDEIIKIELPKILADKLLKMPESGMGYQRVSVYTDDGRKLCGINVYNGEYVGLPIQYKGIKSHNIREIVLEK